MARPHRPAAPGLVYHLTIRGAGRRDVFLTRVDGERFLALLAATARRMDWQVLGYCLMSNHLHLVVRTPEANVSAGMQLLLGRYAQGFNERHDRTGHVFGERFHSVVVADQAHGQWVLPYVALNPVRVGLCEAPHDHRWSSYAATAGLAPAHPALDVATALHVLIGDDDLDEARRRLIALVDAELPPHLRLDGPPPLIHPPFTPPSLDQLVADGRLVEAFDDHGYTHGEIATALGVSRPTAARRVSSARRAVRRV